MRRGGRAAWRGVAASCTSCAIMAVPEHDGYLDLAVLRLRVRALHLLQRGRGAQHHHALALLRALLPPCMAPHHATPTSERVKVEPKPALKPTRAPGLWFGPAAGQCGTRGMRGKGRARACKRVCEGGGGGGGACGRGGLGDTMMSEAVVRPAAPRGQHRQRGQHSGVNTHTRPTPRDITPSYRSIRSPGGGLRRGVRPCGSAMVRPFGVPACSAP